MVHLIFNHAKHLVSGIGHECSIVKQSITTYRSFLMTDTIQDLDETFLIVTAETCDKMIKEKTCFNEPMKCVDSVCESNNEIVKNFEWLTHKKFEVLNCRVTERYIVADSLNDGLFGSPKCKPEDGQCTLANSIILWSVEKLLHKCPLYYVMTTKIVKDDNFVISKDDNIILNIVEKSNFSHCNDIRFFKTSLNLYITMERDSLALPKIDNEIFDLNKLSVANADLIAYKSFESNRHLSFEICLNLENTIRVATLHENKFIIISDNKEQEIVIYVSQGNAYIVKCLNLTNSKIEFLEIGESGDSCDSNLPVRFWVGKTIINGYLGFDMIIRPMDNTCYFKCDTVKLKYYFKKNNKSLIRVGNDLSIVDDYYKSYAKTLDFGTINFDKLNFKHSKLIEDGQDLMLEFFPFKDFNKKVFQIDSKERNNFVDSISETKTKLDQLSNYFNYKVWFVTIIVSIIAALMVSIIVIYLVDKILFTKIKNKICCLNFLRGEKCNQCKINCEKIFNNKTSATKSNKIYKDIELVNMKNFHESDNSVSSKTSNTKSSQTGSIIALELNKKLKNSNNEVRPSVLKDISAYESIRSHFYMNDSILNNKGSNPLDNKYEIQ